MIREARLKPEYASLYPAIKPGVWLTADAVVERLRSRDQRREALGARGRLLSDEHFEFRGGEPRSLPLLFHEPGPADPRETVPDTSPLQE